MNIIENYYYIIIGIGLFIMFALVGYLVEISKKNIKNEKEIKSLDINNDIKDNVVTNNEIDIKSEDISIDNDILNK